MKRDFSIGDLLDFFEMFENAFFTMNIRTATSVSGQILASAKANMHRFVSFTLGPLKQHEWYTCYYRSITPSLKPSYNSLGGVE